MESENRQVVVKKLTRAKLINVSELGSRFDRKVSRLLKRDHTLVSRKVLEIMASEVVQVPGELDQAMQELIDRRALETIRILKGWLAPPERRKRPFKGWPIKARLRG